MANLHVSGKVKLDHKPEYVGSIHTVAGLSCRVYLQLLVEI